MTAASPHEVLTLHGDRGEEVGWLVIDSLVGGMSFGGFRFSPSVTREEVERLARCMSHKLALHGHPVGGAKAGLRCDPRGPEVEGLLDRFVEVAGEALATRAVVGRDMGATDALIDGLYGRLGIPQMAIAGVPTRLREMPGYRRHMTGLGVAFAARRAAGGSLEGARVGVQGFGLVGAGSALRLSALGASVVGISDAIGALHDRHGLDIEALIERSAGSRALPAGSQTLPREGLFGQDLDILVLAASSNSVGVEQASSVRAQVVVEGANFGLTNDAREHLHDRGVCVIPDLIASSSSAAMVARQMRAQARLSDEDLWADIETAIDEATASALEASRRDGVDVRTAYLDAHRSSDA